MAKSQIAHLSQRLKRDGGRPGAEILSVKTLAESRASPATFGAR